MKTISTYGKRLAKFEDMMDDFNPRSGTISLHTTRKGLFGAKIAAKLLGLEVGDVIDWRAPTAYVESGLQRGNAPDQLLIQEATRRAVSSAIDGGGGMLIVSDPHADSESYDPDFRSPRVKAFERITSSIEEGHPMLGVAKLVHELVSR